MSRPPPLDGSLADHEAETVEALSRLHAEHRAAASPLQRAIDAVTAGLGRPAGLIGLLVGLAAWIAWGARSAGGRSDAPVFIWLELAATLTALVIAVLILITQRREDMLAARRDQLTLEMAILADRKTAKIIALLEELRRDDPSLADREDPESEAMQAPADPETVLKAVEAEDPERPK